MKKLLLLLIMAVAMFFVSNSVFACENCDCQKLNCPCVCHKECAKDCACGCHKDKKCDKKDFQPIEFAKTPFRQT